MNPKIEVIRLQLLVFKDNLDELVLLRCKENTRHFVSTVSLTRDEHDKPGIAGITFITNLFKVTPEKIKETQTKILYEINFKDSPF